VSEYLYNNIVETSCFDAEVGFYRWNVQGSSAAEFWNFTSNGLYCHFGGRNRVTHNMSMEVTPNVRDTCRQVRYVTGHYVTALPNGLSLKMCLYIEST
jgi:hypothetical protein